MFLIIEITDEEYQRIQDEYELRRVMTRIGQDAARVTDTALRLIANGVDAEKLASLQKKHRKAAGTRPAKGESS